MLPDLNIINQENKTENDDPLSSDEGKGNNKNKIKNKIEKMDKFSNVIDLETNSPDKTPDIRNYTNKTLGEFQEFVKHFQKHGEYYIKTYKSNNKIENVWGAQWGSSKNTVKNVMKIYVALDLLGILDDDCNKYEKNVQINNIVLKEYKVNCTMLFKIVKYMCCVYVYIDIYFC